jgi:hypothetical protein
MIPNAPVSACGRSDTKASTVASARATVHPAHYRLGRAAGSAAPIDGSRVPTRAQCGGMVASAVASRSGSLAGYRAQSLV